MIAKIQDRFQMRDKSKKSRQGNPLTAFNQNNAIGYD